MSRLWQQVIGLFKLVLYSLQFNGLRSSTAKCVWLRGVSQVSLMEIHYSCRQEYLRTRILFAVAKVKSGVTR
jgi:hypothetical protein